MTAGFLLDTNVGERACCGGSCAAGTGLHDGTGAAAPLRLRDKIGRAHLRHRPSERRAQSERLGRPRNTVDLQLAATAAARDLRVVNCNPSDFEGLGVETLSRWQVA
jgi:hypothetical protein